MSSKIMYKIAKGGKSVQIWKAWTEGAKVIAEYGKEGGKQAKSEYLAEATNVGRSNESNPVEQAQKELEALYVDRKDNKHYRESREEAFEVYNSCMVPMKVANFKDHEKHITYPCYVQRKFNGSRLVSIEDNFYSKIGRKEDCAVPHIREQVKKLGINIDSELYCHGLSLQRIRSATTKPNEDTPSLGLKIFDVPLRDVPFSVRIRTLRSVDRAIRSQGLNHLEVELPVICNNREELVEFYESVTPEYEGVVIRCQESMFEFGVRSYLTQKLKPRYDAEAFVTGVEKCKNGTGKLLLRACESLDNVTFKCMMKVKRRDGNEYPRMFEDMEKLVGQWITFSYEELSDKGVPTKPVGEMVRKCDEAGEPLE